MGKVSIWLHGSVQEYLDKTAEIMGLSRSETVSDVIRYIKENVDEKKVWDEYDDKLEDYEDALESEGEDESEEESLLED